MTVDNALLYQIMRDALDHDPAVAWRSKPFASSLRPLRYRLSEADLPRAQRTVRFSWLRWRVPVLWRRTAQSCCAPACC